MADTLNFDDDDQTWLDRGATDLDMSINILFKLGTIQYQIMGLNIH